MATNKLIITIHSVQVESFAVTASTLRVAIPTRSAVFDIDIVISSIISFWSSIYKRSKALEL